MDRREFVRLAATATGTAALAEVVVSARLAALPGSAQSRPASVAAVRTRMHVGTQHGDSDAILQACAAFGVNNICSRLPAPTLDAAWSVESLSKLKDRVASFGISLDMVPLPLSSSEISRSESPGIFSVHFRNISGGFLNFRETFIDNGDVDMLKAMRVYKAVGYDGMLMPDHVPQVEGDANQFQGFAFAFGYIKALLAAVNAEA